MTTRRPGFPFLCLLTGLLMAAPTQAFWNPFKALDGFMKKLSAMNQGATVKDRWNNLVNPPAGAPAAAGNSVFAESVTDGPRASQTAGIPASILIDPIRKLLAESVSRLPEIADHDERSLALARLLETWKTGFRTGLRSRSGEIVEALWTDGAGLFEIDHEAAHRAVALVAAEFPGPLGEDLNRRASRACKAARRISSVDG